VNPQAGVAASYQRVERSHPGRILIGLDSSHAGMTQGQDYRPYQKMVSYLDELDAFSLTVPTDRRSRGATRCWTHRRDAAGADHMAIQVLTAGDYGHGSLPRQQWRELASALKNRSQL
jgi:hypothetical protein